MIKEDEEEEESVCWLTNQRNQIHMATVRFHLVRSYIVY